MVAVPVWAQLLLTFVKPVLMFIGGASLLTLLILKFAHKLPARASSWLQDKLFRKGMSIGGGLQMLIQDSDGVLKLAPAEYDSKNSGYWANLGEGWEFFSSEGDGGSPMHFYGGAVVLAYDGLGATSDLVSAKIGEEAKLKKRVEDRSLLDHARERYREFIPEESDPLATDGGLPEYVNEFSAYVPERAVVDLRDTLYNVPFHVRPAQFHRVEENAKAGQGTGLNENLIRFGLLITGFMLAVIAFVVMGGGGGGGSAQAAGSAVLPMGG